MATLPAAEVVLDVGLTSSASSVAVPEQTPNESLMPHHHCPHVGKLRSLFLTQINVVQKRFVSICTFQTLFMTISIYCESKLEPTNAESKIRFTHDG